MEKDQGLKNRFKELANKSYNQGVYTFTDFLGLMEQDIYSQIESELSYVGVTRYGGTKDSERVMLRFGREDELGYIVDFPIKCLVIKPSNKKFADDLTHRDFLGALMNLGIRRELLGDIIIHENEGYIFCTEQISEFIINNLFRVRHTSVLIEEFHDNEIITDLYSNDYKSQFITVDSKRLDAIIAKIYKMSRSTSINFFIAGKVYVNGKLCTSNSQLIKNGDIVSIRGKGRIKYLGNESISKKGRTRLEMWVL